MATASNTPPNSTAFIACRSFWDILKTGWHLHAQYLLALNWPIVKGWVLMSLGAILAIVLPVGGITWLIDQNIFGDAVALVWVSLILALMPGLVLFCRGFWHTMLWLSALNLLFRDLAETGTCLNPSVCELRIATRRVDYAVILALLLIAQALPLLIALSVFIYVSLINFSSDWQATSLIIGAALGSIAVLCMFLASVLFCLSYQVFAFEPGGSAAVLLLAVQRVFQSPFKATALVILNFITLQTLWPELCLGISHPLGLHGLFSKGIEPGIQYYFSQFPANDPVATSILDTLSIPEISQTLVDMGITTSAAILSLPLATCWFALLYADCRAKSQPAP